MPREYLPRSPSDALPQEEAELLAQPEDIQRYTLQVSLDQWVLNWARSLPRLPALAAGFLERHANEPPGEGLSSLRCSYAQWLLFSGDFDALPAVIAQLRDDEKATGGLPFADVFSAAAEGLQGRWAHAELAYDNAIQAFRAALRERKTGLPEILLLPYIQSLLAQGTPAHIDKALKFCQVETGRRVSVGNSPLDVVAFAVRTFRGTAATAADLPLMSTARHVYRIDFWLLLMRAWLEANLPGGAFRIEQASAELKAAGAMSSLLWELGLERLAQQVDAALARVSAVLPEPGPGETPEQIAARAPLPDEAFFLPTHREQWRTALDGLAALADAAAAVGEREPPPRIVWVIALHSTGEIEDIVPFEHKRGARGMLMPKKMTLAQLKAVQNLGPADALVLRAVRPDPYGRRERLDLAAAAAALLGHPALEFEDAPGIAVTLAEGQPALDVTDMGDALELRLAPAPRSATAVSWPQTAAEVKEAEALRLITVVRDTPQQARLIRMTTEHVRAARLIGERLKIPKTALPQLQRALKGLGAHFQVHADGVEPHADVRGVTAEPRLRAELSPLASGVSLRLVVAPFGPSGPRLIPGQGRAQMMATVGGETLAAERDLKQERELMDSVIDACPVLASRSFLGGVAEVSAEWAIDEPEDALALVERLPKLPAVAALDWPKGQPIRVDSVSLGQLYVKLRTGQEWLALEGGVKVNEQLVATLGELIASRAQGQSRFVPLGEGRYLALTDELRARLDDLSAVARHVGGVPPASGSREVQVPAMATAWLRDALDGVALDADPAFQKRLEVLAEAQYTVPVLPATLQAEFRPYQEEGYAWAMRLARAGFGAVLADDMGLGKTLQALAVLAARAGGGPALVIAPTSLGANWIAEARRFTPTLRVRQYAGLDQKASASAATPAAPVAPVTDATTATPDRNGASRARAALIDEAGAGDVLVVSYQLLQLNAAEFGARRWHTLVADEAQAIKNAGAKRSLAVFSLEADFKLALSGTPVENRLSELWSIMRLCNPGLLGSRQRFNERFANPIERDRNRVAQRTLRRLIEPFILRRTRSQVLDDLPPRTETTVLVELPPEERAHYEALRRHAVAVVERAIGSDKAGEAHLNILAQLTKLRRAACDPRLVSPELGGIGAKAKAFGELAAELAANGHKALVFSQFVDFLTLLREPLDEAGIAYQYLDGSTPAAERQRRVDAFQSGEGTLFLISLKAGGFGLNLTAADYVVIADPWWNPAAEDQASGRAHRIGQKRPVTVYRMVAAGTLEERIVALHQRKRELADSVLEGGEAATVLDVSALADLIKGGNAEE